MTAWLRSTLLVATVITALVPSSPAAAPQAPKDVVDTAIAAGSFKTLVSAIQAAGLVSQLKGAGPYTVFAPTDEAFAKIPKADLDALIKDKPKLTRVLTNHVFAGNANSTDLTQLRDLSVASGSRLPIVVVSKGRLTIGGANVVKADIAASNGVIHVVDAVLVPK